MSWLVPLFQGNKQAKAINNASNAQIAADQKAIDENARQFDTTQANLKPWLDAGRTALGGQMDLLGLGGTPASPGSPAGGPAPGSQNWSGYLQAYPDVAQEAQRATGTGEFPSPEAYAQYHFQNYGQGEGRTVPTYGAAEGTSGTPGVDAATAQQRAIDALKGSPLYQSIYRNGVDTIDANASATGGLRGGNTQRSLANFGADSLSAVIQQQLQALGGISGAGQTTGTNLGQLGANSASTIGNLYVGQGQDRAGGILGASQARIAGQNDSLKQLTDAVAMIAKMGGF